MSDVKCCPHCRKEKPPLEFSWRDKEHTRRSSWCCDCINVASKQYRLNNVERYRHASRDRERRRRRDKGLVPMLRHWDIEEEDYLTCYWGVKPDAEIAAHLGRTLNSIRLRAHAIYLSKRRRREEVRLLEKAA